MMDDSLQVELQETDPDAQRLELFASTRPSIQADKQIIQAWVTYPDRHQEKVEIDFTADPPTVASLGRG